jgi:hypothetical protein
MCVSSFINIGTVTAELFHAEGQDETSGRFSQFCEKRLKTTEVVHGEETEVLEKQRFRELARNAKFRTTQLAAATGIVTAF